MSELCAYGRVRKPPDAWWNTHASSHHVRPLHIQVLGPERRVLAIQTVSDYGIP